MKLERSGWMTGMAFALSAVGGVAFAATSPDHMVLVVDSAKATGGASIAAYGYDPINDVVYAVGYTGGAQIRQVTNVSNPAMQVSTLFVTTNDWLMFLKDGHTDWSCGTPTLGSLVLNPRTVYEADGVTVKFGPYTQAWIEDAATAVREGTSTYHYELTQRVYRYNLQAVGLPGNPPPPYGDGRDVFTSLATLQQMADAIGVTPPGTSNIQKQVAFSTDGEWVYFTESGPTYGGIWKVRARDGSGLTRLHQATGSSTADRIYTEPGVVHTSVRDLDPSNPATGDQILFEGRPLTGNNGGIDYLIHDGTNVSTPIALLTSATLKTFLETTSDTHIFAIQVDDVGNIYFDDTTTKVLGLYDTVGRLIKVKSRLEQIEFNSANGSTGTGAATQKLQWRSTQYDPTGGDPSDAFPVKQLLFASVDLKAIGGIYCFKPCDFNRDNSVDNADVVVFRTMLAKGPTTPPNTDPDYLTYLKCDLNGNGSVSAMDIEILKRFVVDTDEDSDVDLADFSFFQSCFNGPNRPYAQANCDMADYDMDDDVDLTDFAFFQSCFNGPNRPLNCAQL